ncbi:MAG: P-loop NTPase fold protein [Phycisphaerae bacterium]|jgi:hypothetical protein
MSVKIRSSEFVIPKDNPFANDKLDRKKCADSLTNLVQNISGQLVININGGWGTGKTVFLKMWKQSLQNSGFTTIYFSAWEDDYCDDALIALIGQIWKDLKNSDFKEIAQTVKNCVAPIFKNTVFNAVRTMSAGVIDLDEKQLHSISEKAVDEYLVAGEKLQDLMKRLEELAQKISKDGKPLVIIVDELDRCKPIFAIELLEKIKHLFSIAGIVFVLGTDREQLGHSIKCIYGQDMDVNGYLRRFIDMEFILPVPNIEVFCSHIFNQFGLNEYFQKRLQATKGQLDDKRILSDIFAKLCACFQFSLRDIEHCCKMFVLAYMNTKEDHFIYPPLLAVLAVLKLANSKLYHRYVTGKCNSEKIMEYILEQPQGEVLLNTRQGIFVEAYLFAASPQNWRDIAHYQMTLLYTKKELTQPEYLSERIKKMSSENLGELLDRSMRLINNFEGEITNSTLGYLSSKIELVSLMLGYIE